MLPSSLSRYRILALCAALCIFVILSSDRPIFFLRVEGDKCQCEYKGVFYDLCYRHPRIPSLVGKRFDCNSLAVLDDIGFLDPISYVSETDSFDDTVFATAYSDNHFHEGNAMISYFQPVFPGQKLIYIDMGLTKEHRMNISQHCDIIYRKFPWEKFPEMFKEMFEYRFKAAFISLLMLEFKSVFIMDASIRWNVNDTGEHRELFDCYKKNPNGPCKKSPQIFNIDTYHGNGRATNRVMFEYLPVNFTEFSKVRMLASGFQYIVRTKETMDNMKWFLLCALEKDCFAPPNSLLKCNFGKDAWSDDPVCHRFDQAALNIIIGNRYKYKLGLYRSHLNRGSHYWVDRSANKPKTIKTGCGKRRDPLEDPDMRILGIRQN